MMDFRRRCAVRCVLPDGQECEMIRYGVSASEMGSPWRDLQESYSSHTATGRQAERPARQLFRGRIE